MSRSHDLLTQQSWQSASMLDIAHDALAPFSVKDGERDRIVIGLGEDVRIAPKMALALGIALNELATNAAKFGALSNETGQLLVQWTIISKPSGQRLVISWQESNGPAVSPPKRRGFGSQVLERGLAMEIDAQVSLNYAPSGLQCSIDIPLVGELHG
jgi:two-component sensor histidine kinase